MANTGIIRPFDHQLGLLHRLADASIIVITLVACFWAYHGVGAWSDKYSILAVSAVAFFYLAARSNALYQSFRVGGLMQETRPLLTSWFVALAGLLLMGYAFKVTHEMSRLVLGFWAALTPVFLMGWRQVVRSFLKSMRARGRNTRTAVIVGVNDSARALARNIVDRPWMGLKLQGFFSDDHQSVVNIESAESGEVVPFDVLGNMHQLYWLARGNQVDIVYIAVPAHEHALIETLMQQLGNSTVSIYMVPDMYTAGLMQGDWVTVGDIPTVTVIDNPTLGMDAWIKRAQDVLVAGLALAVLALPMLLIAIGVKLSSPGPVIYRQRRYGINGKSIEVWKFRSMTVTENDSEFVQAQKNDKRVTAFGSFLRKTSLDELPQFINALKGDMSVVGPRPHAEAHNEQFREKINGYMLRHKVKPGITGLAQINGCRGETDTDEKMEQRVRYDVEYINNWSLWLDLAILFKTPFTLLNDENAY